MSDNQAHKTSPGSAGEKQSPQENAAHPFGAWAGATTTIGEILNKKGLNNDFHLQGTQRISREQILASKDILGLERYHVRQEIGSGGMGQVHKVRDKNLCRDVALKVMLPNPKNHHQRMLRFIEEAQITAQLEHPNIIPVHELGLDKNQNIFYTMKYTKGTLKDLLEKLKDNDNRARKKFPFNTLLEIFLKICDAVAFAHHKKVINRDLKPENIMIGEFGEVLVMDWGLAKLLNEGAKSAILKRGAAAPRDPTRTQGKTDGQGRQSDGDTTSEGTGGQSRSRPKWAGGTTVGKVQGTPLFMAPEQARGKNMDVDHRSDIYALGSILYQILTLRMPIEAETIDELLKRKVRGEITPPHQLPRDQNLAFLHPPKGKVPAALSHVAMKAMALNPQDRYQSVLELQRDVSSYMGGYATEAEGATLMQHLLLFCKRRPRLVTLAALTLALTLCFGAYVAWRWDQRWARWTNVCDIDFTEPNPDLSKFTFMNPTMNAQTNNFTTSPEGLRMAPRQWMWLKDAQIHGNVRVEARAVAESPDGLDICVNASMDPPEQWFELAHGFSCQVGGYQGEIDTIETRHPRSQTGFQDVALSKIKAGTPFNLVFERLDDRCVLRVDGAKILELTDPRHYAGPEMKHVGLRTWSPDLRLLRLTVRKMSLPRKTSPLAVPEALNRRGHHVKAVENFLEMARDYAGTELAKDALVKAALVAYLQMDQETRGKWRERIEPELEKISLEPHRVLRLLEARAVAEWKDGRHGQSLEIAAEVLQRQPKSKLMLQILSAPHSKLPAATLQQLLKLIALNHDIKTLDLSGMGIDNLEPLAGMPLIRLVCDDNQIHSLKPLQGMPLRQLHCQNNQIQSLDGLREAPLRQLNCSNNPVAELEPLKTCRELRSLSCSNLQIQSLEPLRSLPLNILDAAVNSIQSLEPLRESPLTSLNLSSCHDVADLEPLRNLPLRTLKVNECQVTDLEPLAGGSLRLLEASGNQIADLEPLRGMPLANLLLAFNQIRDLEPLARSRIHSLNCAGNQVQNLAPLAELELNDLICADNPIDSLQPLIDTPPKNIFLFDSPKLSDQQLETAALRWTRHPARASLADEAEKLLAIRRGDLPKLKSLAQDHWGRKYLFVPKLLNLNEARSLAERLQARLVDIESNNEKKFVFSIIPKTIDMTIWVWTGMRVDAPGKLVDAKENPVENPGKLMLLDSTHADAELSSGPVSIGSNGYWGWRNQGGNKQFLIIEWDHP